MPIRFPVEPITGRAPSRAAILVGAVALAALCTLPASARGQAAGTAPGVRAPLPADSVAIARRYAAWFLRGQVDSLFPHYTDSLRTEMKSPEGLLQTWAQFDAQAGREVELVEERWLPGRTVQRYARIARYERAPEPVVLLLYLTPRAELQYVGLSLLSQVRELATPAPAVPR